MTLSLNTREYKMSFILKRDPVWLASLPLRCVNEAFALLISDNGCQVPISASVLLAASPLVRSISSGLPPALCPIVLSVPTESRDILEAVVEIMTKGSWSSMLNFEKVAEIKEVFCLLEVELVLNSFDSDSIKVGVKDDDKNVIRDVDVVEVKNEYDIEIEIEIKKENNMKEMDLNNKLIEGDDFPDPPMKRRTENIVEGDKRTENRKDTINERDLCESKVRYGDKVITRKRMKTGERSFECDECDYIDMNTMIA